MHETLGLYRRNRAGREPGTFGLRVRKEQHEGGGLQFQLRQRLWHRRAVSALRWPGHDRAEPRYRTGELINGNYGEAVLGHISSHGGTAIELYLVYGTPGIDAAALVGYPITGAVADTSSPATTQTGTFTVPSGFVSAQGYTVNSCGQILVSGDTSAEAEMLTMIGGSRVLG